MNYSKIQILPICVCAIVVVLACLSITVRIYKLVEDRAQNAMIEIQMKRAIECDMAYHDAKTGEIVFNDFAIEYIIKGEKISTKTEFTTMTDQMIKQGEKK